MKTKKFIDFCYHCFKVALLGAPILAVGIQIVYAGIDRITNFNENYDVKVVQDVKYTAINLDSDVVDYSEYRYYVPYDMSNLAGFFQVGFHSYNDISIDVYSIFQRNDITSIMYHPNGYINIYNGSTQLGSFSKSNYANSDLFNTNIFFLADKSNTILHNTIYQVSTIFSESLDTSLKFNNLIANSMFNTGLIAENGSFNNTIDFIYTNYVGDYNIDFAYGDLIDDGVLNSLTFTKLNITQVFGLSASNDGYDIYSLLWLDYYLNYLLSMGVLLIAFDVLYWFVRFVRKMLEKPLNRVEGGR